MAIFTAIAAAILAEFAITSTFAIGALSFALSATPTQGVAFVEPLQAVGMSDDERF